MDYEISYHPEQKKRYPQGTPQLKWGKWLIIACTLVLAAAFVKPYIPGIREIIREYRQVYDFNIISQHLKAGDTLENSVTAFCLNVLRHAKIS